MIIYNILIFSSLCNTILDTNSENTSSQLWRLTEDSKLENGFTSKWDFEDAIWSLPPNGTEGYIKENSTGLVLTVVGSNVELQKNKSSKNQKWIRGNPEPDDLFTLINPSSNKALANNVTQIDNNIYSTEIKSKYVTCHQV